MQAGGGLDAGGVRRRLRLDEQPPRLLGGELAQGAASRVELEREDPLGLALPMPPRGVARDRVEVLGHRRDAVGEQTVRRPLVPLPLGGLAHAVEQGQLHALVHEPPRPVAVALDEPGVHGLAERLVDVFGGHGEHGGEQIRAEPPPLDRGDVEHPTGLRPQAKQAVHDELHHVVRQRDVVQLGDVERPLAPLGQQQATIEQGAQKLLQREGVALTVGHQP